MAHRTVARFSINFSARLPSQLRRILVIVLCLTCTGSAMAQPSTYTRIQVNDDVGDPLSCVRLFTNNHVSVFTDEAGVAGFFEPGLHDGRWVRLNLEREGYTDKFAILVDTVMNGGSITIAMTPEVATPPPCSPGLDASNWVAGPLPVRSDYQAIRIVDSLDPSRGVPLVRVSTAKQDYWTDSNGFAAILSRDLGAADTLLPIWSHGYQATSVTLPTPWDVNNILTVPIVRDNIAERLYRITGGGNYRDSQLLEQAHPAVEPFLNSGVLGQDSTLTEIYRGKLHWIWGDTTNSNNIHNFRVTAAWSLLPGELDPLDPAVAPGLDPDDGVDLHYYENGNFVRSMVTFDPIDYTGGSTLAWFGWLLNLDDNGQERLYSRYGFFPGLSAPVETGLAWFDDCGGTTPCTELYRRVMAYSGNEAVALEGHPVRVYHGVNEYAYFHHQGLSATTLPAAEDFINYFTLLATGLVDLVDNPTRVRTTIDTIENPSLYEAFTPLNATTGQVERDATGAAVYEWRANAPIVVPGTGDGLGLEREYRLFGHLRDIESSDPQAGITPGHPSTEWNDYRQRYVRVFTQFALGSSFFGEQWYGEADTPMGPWVYARKVVTHDNYTVYNLRQHRYFNEDGGRIIYFEGTYTRSFTFDAQPTPRHNYNQVMYRLDLSNESLILPVPIYDLADVAQLPGEFVTRAGLRPGPDKIVAPFMAPDRQRPGTYPLVPLDADCRGGRLALISDGSASLTPLFYAAPATTPAPVNTVALMEFENVATGELAYTVDGGGDFLAPTWSSRTVAFVWENPLAIAFPVRDHLGDLIADAGPDQCLQEYASGTGVSVLLNAANSVGADNYQWTWAGGSASGASPLIQLPAGIHEITLVTSTATADTEDRLVISVAAANPTNPPPGCAYSPNGRLDLLLMLMLAWGIFYVRYTMTGR